MSGLGQEFTTEFGEFLDFHSNVKSDRRHEDPFQSWRSISEMDVTQAANFGRIAEAVAKAKEEMEKAKQ